MARDPKFTMAMRNATTHEGTGGNPNVGVPVGFVRPPPFSWSPSVSLTPCLPCSRVDTCLLTPSQGSSAKCATDPYEDTCARASLASLMRLKSEGNKPALVRESEAVLVSSPKVSSLPACLLTCPSPKPSAPLRVSWSLPLVSLSVRVPPNPTTREPHRQHKVRQDIRQQDKTRQTIHDKPIFSSRFSSSRFARPTPYESLSQSSDDEDDFTFPEGPLLSLPEDPFILCPHHSSHTSHWFSCLL
jgi:hypothetical protein